MPNVVVTLVSPIEGESQIKTVTLREPKFDDLMLLGEPKAYARSEGGMVYTAERDGVIQAYIQRLLVEPKDPALLVQLCLADTIQLKEAVYDFFQSARQAIAAKSSTV